MTEDARQFAPATLRNRDAILDVLQRYLPEDGLVLEVASGTGEHIVHFARHCADLIWQPSDPSPEARASIAAWLADQPLPNVLPPLALDAAEMPWPINAADALVCINMVHISPWEATLGLMQGAGTILAQGAPLLLYGPYRRSDRPLEPSNADFDQSLKERDPRWGLRELDAVIALAEENGLRFVEVVEMPANNCMPIFTKC